MIKANFIIVSLLILFFFIIMILLNTGFLWSFSHAYSENKEIWESVDKINKKYEYNKLSIAAVFEESLKILRSRKLEDEFELLRIDAFKTENFTKLDSLVERAKPVFSVIVMGESNSIGINVKNFIKKSRPGSTDFRFFKLTENGFYFKNKGSYSYGISGFPAWIKRTESSFQGVTDKKAARKYLERWKKLYPGLNGVYKKVAIDTIKVLLILIKSKE